MNGTELPATLGEAIVTEPAWLLAWLVVLVLAHLGALGFVAVRSDGSWQLRRECLAIVGSFIAGGLIMDLMYGAVGYVRLLGLAHLLAWTPAYLYVLFRRREIGIGSWYGRYIHFYLLMAGISLVIDAVDVVRYLAGDGDLYLRWAEGV